jgi:putative secretion ATPase (PEP-CTERM system associated)
MYERFYELRERPFALSPDPDYLYPSRVHREALDYLRYGLESHAGFIVITGEIGSGKTTLLQTVLRGLDGQTTVARIVNTMLDPREVLETIMIDLGLDPAGRSKPLLLRDLSQYLVDQRLAGRMVLVVIDEAQNLSLAALEELRMLSNLETEKSKLLQIVLVGQPNLRDKMGAPELEQLRQRITVSYHLEPLDASETANYINHRLKRAAIGAPLEFARDVTNAIHARSGGVPRVVNVICDAALVFGYAEDRRHIDTELIQEVLGELELTGVLPKAAPAEQRPAVAALGAQRPAATAAVALRVPVAAPVEHPSPAVATVDRRAPVAVATAPPPPRPAVAVPPDVSVRVAQLDQRERALVQRERELAEQRRILAEEYRLLRARSVAAAHTTSFDPEYVHSEAIPGIRQASLWNRFKRAMLGSPAVE